MPTTQIVESFTVKAELLERDSSVKNDAILCRAKYQICSIGEKNRNNRMYSKEVWEKVLGDKDIKEKLANRSLFFHAEHPTTTQSNTEKVAGVVTEIKVEGDKVFSIMEVLNTPYGQIVDTLLKAKCGIGVSTRADGELEEAMDESGGKYQRVIPESYRFVTIDFTADPSSFGSEMPLSVEHNLTNVIKTGIDDSKMERKYATAILEQMKAPEAIALLESIKNDKGHKDCKCKTSEKKCTKGCKKSKVNESLACECGTKKVMYKDQLICPSCKQAAPQTLNAKEPGVPEPSAEPVVTPAVAETIQYGKLNKQKVNKIKEFKNLAEAFGDVIVDKASYKAHYGNVLGIFWYNANNNKLDYSSDINSNHSKIGNQNEFKDNPNAYRGRFAKDSDGKNFIML